MTREEALKLVQEKVREPELIRHMQAVAAIMEGLAGRLGEDAERWYLAGLLHDIDYEETKDDPDRHSILGAEMLAGLGFDREIVYAVKAHGRHGDTVPRLSVHGQGPVRRRRPVRADHRRRLRHAVPHPGGGAGEDDQEEVQGQGLRPGRRPGGDHGRCEEHRPLPGGVLRGGPAMQRHAGSSAYVKQLCLTGLETSAAVSRSGRNSGKTELLSIYHVEINTGAGLLANV